MNRLYRSRHRFLSKNDIEEIYNQDSNFEMNKNELTPVNIIQKNFIDKEDDDQQLLGIILLNELNDKIPDIHYSNLLIGTTNIRVYNKYSKDHNIVLFGSKMNKSKICEFGELIKKIDFVNKYKYIFLMEPNIQYIFDEKKLDDYNDRYDFVVPHKLYPCKKEFFTKNNIKYLCIDDNKYYHILDDNKNEKDILYEISQQLRYVHTSISLFAKMASFLSLPLYDFHLNPGCSLYYSILLDHKLVRFIDPSIYSYYYNQISEYPS